MASSAEEIEDQFLLRLPAECASRVRRCIHDDTLDERLQIQFFGDMRQASVKLDGKVLAAKMVDLPCVVESCKTLDNKTFYKTGDVCQMLVCSGEESDVAQPDSLSQQPLAKHREARKKYQWNHGITPPLKNVRKRRFRKTAPKKYIDSPEVEKEVQRLIKEDLSAVHVTFKLLGEDEQSEGAGSRQVTPPPDSESNELLRILAEASSASSSSSSSDEEEINVQDVEDSTPQTRSVEVEAQLLRESIRALQFKISNQRSKLKTESNTLLKKRFTGYLKELEEELAERKEKLEALGTNIM